jgi:hypothetical protein
MALVTSAISCFRSFSAACSFGAFISISPFAALLGKTARPQYSRPKVNSL